MRLSGRLSRRLHTVGRPATGKHAQRRLMTVAQTLISGRPRSPLAPGEYVRETTVVRRSRGGYGPCASTTMGRDKGEKEYAVRLGLRGKLGVAVFIYLGLL